MALAIRDDKWNSADFLINSGVDTNVTDFIILVKFNSFVVSFLAVV